MSAALDDGSRWLLVGGRRALAKADRLSFAATDPDDLGQIAFSNGGAATFHGIAGDSLLRFDGPLGKAETVSTDARFSGAKLQAFAGRLLVRPLDGDPFLIGADGRGEAALASMLPFEPSVVSFGSATAGFAMTDAFGLLKTNDGARSWTRAATLLEGVLATRQGVPVEFVQGSGKTTALQGFALATLENKTAALIDRSGKDPLALAAASGIPLDNGDIVVALPKIEPGSTVGVTLLRLAGSTGEVLLAKPLPSYPLKPLPIGTEPRCAVARAPRDLLLVECDGHQLYEVNEVLQLSEARFFEGKLRLSDAGTAVAEGDCLGGIRSEMACVRNSDGSFTPITFEREMSSSATLVLGKTDGGLIVVDYVSQGFTVREVDKTGVAKGVAKFGSRVRASKIHGDLDQGGALTLVVEGPVTLGSLPQVEVSTVVDGRVKTDSFPGAITGRNVGGRVVMRSENEIILREQTRGPWKRLARKSPPRGEVRVSQAGFVVGDDVRLGWPVSGPPAPEGSAVPSSGQREMVCKIEKNLRTLPRLDNSTTFTTVPEWTRTLGGKLAIAREGSRYRVRFFTRLPVGTIEEFYVPTRSIAPLTIVGAGIRGADAAVIVTTGTTSWAIRHVNGANSIEKITTPLLTKVDITIGADGSVAWDRGRAGARQIVLWPKSGAPRDALTTDRNNFNFEPFDKGLEVRAIGWHISSVARYPLSELGETVAIDPARFQVDPSLAKRRLLSAPACRVSPPPEARLFDWQRPLTSVVVDGERQLTPTFDVGFARGPEGPCMAFAEAFTERDRWQVGVDMSTGTALVTKNEYQRLPASCGLQSIERKSP